MLMQRGVVVGGVLDENETILESCLAIAHQGKVIIAIAVDVP